jgi:hypothetical protein
MVDPVGRPPKPESEKYTSRQFAFRAPSPLDAEIAKVLAERDESITDFMVRAAQAEVRRHRRHAKKEPRPPAPDTPATD